MFLTHCTHINFVSVRIASKTLSRQKPLLSFAPSVAALPPSSLSLFHTNETVSSRPAGLSCCRCRCCNCNSNSNRSVIVVRHSHCPLIITAQVTAGHDQWTGTLTSTFHFSFLLCCCLSSYQSKIATLESLSLWVTSFRIYLKMHHFSKPLRRATSLLLDQVAPTLPQLTCFRSLSSATAQLLPPGKTHTASCPFAEKSQSFQPANSSACPFSGALKQQQHDRKRSPPQLDVTREESTGLPFDQIPTPPSLPIVGTLFDLILAGGAEYVHQYCDKRHKTLGPIYREKLGNIEAVFLSDAKLIQKVRLLFFVLHHWPLSILGVQIWGQISTTHGTRTVDYLQSKQRHSTWSLFYVSANIEQNSSLSVKHY